MANEYIELTNRQIEENQLGAAVFQFVEDFDALCIRVRDGDTIMLKAEQRDFAFPLRFLDIDTKELSEGGEEAKEWLKNQIEGQEVQIKINRKNRVDKYGRLLGKVVYRGLDLGQQMIYLGLAKPFTERNEGKFMPLSQLFSLSRWF